MPTGITYAKAAQNFNATVANGFLNFSYEVVDNYNTDTSTGDSTTLYSYYFPETAVALTLIVNQDSGLAELFELTHQNIQLSFAAGEYYDISNGVTLDVGAVYGLVIGALSI
jgi:hypothetical protein